MPEQAMTTTVVYPNGIRYYLIVYQGVFLVVYV